MRRLSYAATIADSLSLVNAATATLDPTAGATGVIPAVPAEWNRAGIGAVPELDIEAWAAGGVTLTNVDLMAGVVKPGTIAVTSVTGNAATDLITGTSHGLITGDAVSIFTAGTMPAPLIASTAYYVIWASANTFKLATTRANALAGVAIDLTSNGSGATETEANQTGADRGLMRWLPIDTLTASIALTKRSGFYKRVKAHPAAIAYAIRGTWGGAVAASFIARPVWEG